MADFTVNIEHGLLAIARANSRKARKAMPETFTPPKYERGLAMSDVDSFMNWVESKGFTVSLAQS